MTRADVYEVNVQTVDLGQKLGSAFRFASTFRQS